VHDALDAICVGSPRKLTYQYNLKINQSRDKVQIEKVLKQAAVMWDVKS